MVILGKTQWKAAGVHGLRQLGWHRIRGKRDDGRPLTGGEAIITPVSFSINARSLKQSCLPAHRCCPAELPVGPLHSTGQSVGSEGVQFADYWGRLLSLTTSALRKPGDDSSPATSRSRSAGFRALESEESSPPTGGLGIARCVRAVPFRWRASHAAVNCVLGMPRAGHESSSR
jgi:hypothetical protein